jgi:hypothetical protein
MLKVGTQIIKFLTSVAPDLVEGFRHFFPILCVPEVQSQDRQQSFTSGSHKAATQQAPAHARAPSVAPGQQASASRWPQNNESAATHHPSFVATQPQKSFTSQTATFQLGGQPTDEGVTIDPNKRPATPVRPETPVSVRSPDPPSRSVVQLLRLFQPSFFAGEEGEAVADVFRRYGVTMAVLTDPTWSSDDWQAMMDEISSEKCVDLAYSLPWADPVA